MGVLRDEQAQGKLPSFHLVELNGMRLVNPHQVSTSALVVAARSTMDLRPVHYAVLIVVNAYLVLFWRNWTIVYHFRSAVPIWGQIT